MNKTAIEWTDYSWNPVTGCWGPGGTAEKPNRCSYCYAERVARRFAKDKSLPPKGYRDFFPPTFHPDRLSQPAKVKKPSKIFVCSMADLFGDWVPDNWIHQVLMEAWLNPQHTFQFLTKNPKRLLNFDFSLNCWIGTTVTCQADADERLPWLIQVDAPVRFVSHEPLLSMIDVGPFLKREQYKKDQFGIKMSPLISWAILGAMTGPGAVRPKRGWVSLLMEQYQAAGVPIFLKDNLWRELEKIQEFPA